MGDVKKSKKSKTSSSAEDGGQEDDEELERSAASDFRRLAARGVYLSQDRGDISYAVKELARSMAKPTQRDQRNLKRLGRYLIDKTSMSQH